ncbi:hypothetical protein [Ilumatobacter sp.]|uniref:hypothetical protein n=1 Tax=Ilumatobacter sp. TaxID=1967498 RepID=UPI003C3DE19E
MKPLERLRLATALSHTVPGAKLHLRTDRGESVVVGEGAHADNGPCAMRRVVAASACPNQPDLSEHLVDISVGGALTDVGGGVFSTCRNGIEQRWIATTLLPDRVAQVLADVGLDAVPDEAMHAAVKPDSGLAVTVLAITTSDMRFHHMLDEIAVLAAGACLVEELSCDVSRLAPSNETAGGVS